MEIIGTNQNRLAFRLVRRKAEEASYLATLQAGWLTAKTEFSTYISGPPVGFFVGLADSWSGWDGEKKWEDLEHRLGLSATSNRTGHITIKVELRDAHYVGRAIEILRFDAGSLENLACVVKVFFEENTN